MSLKLVELLNANPTTRADYLEKRGLNGSNEGGIETTSKQFGYEVTDSLGNINWISQALFEQLGNLFKDSAEAEDKPATDNLLDFKNIYNVYSEDRRDVINAKPENEKPKVIRVTTDHIAIPDGYIRVEVEYQSDIYILK